MRIAGDKDRDTHTPLTQTFASQLLKNQMISGTSLGGSARTHTLMNSIILAWS